MAAHSPRQLLEIIVKAADDRLGEDITALDVRGLTALADYFVIVTARNARQSGALLDAIEEAIETNGYDIRAIEGKGGNRWLLIDAHDVITHIMTAEAREEYGLEKLWSDAKHVDLSEFLDTEGE